MAIKTFLTEPQVQQALEILKSKSSDEVSRYVAQSLEIKLSSHPFWQVSQPIKLGSWSRGELCAKSDIDLLFIGDEKKVKSMVDDFFAEGLKIRYRVPESKMDWSIGVQSFDIIALLDSVPFFESDNAELSRQKLKMQSLGVQFKRKLLSDMMKERKLRALRYDSIANYLEPNIKYGSGGLRDLQQGLQILKLFPQQSVFFANAPTQKLKNDLLLVRHFLHLSGGGDILVASLQKEAADFFGFNNHQFFMKQVELQLSDVSFFADAAAEAANTTEKKKSQLAKIEIENLEQAIGALKKEPSLLLQSRLRGRKIRCDNRKSIGALLEKNIHSDMSDQYLRSLFRSDVLANLIPQLSRVKGQVQHDQYHRYSVDAHTLQAVRETLRVKRHPKLLGRLGSLGEKLTPKEWKVLVWTALYHDLGKGLKRDHSTEGAEIAKSDLIGMGVSLSLTAQVVWMVQNHLVMSAAAFKQNPLSPKVWADLFSRGVRDRRILKLGIFTAIDIRATNPDAWNDWKERLLFELTEALLSPQANRIGRFLDYAEFHKVKVDRNFIEKLDAALVHDISEKVLLLDYQQLLRMSKKSKPEDLPLLLHKNKKKEIWIRFHRAQDKSGLFLQFVSRLTSLGLSIQEAYVQTYERFGVYDWFKVRSTKKISILKKILDYEAEAPKLSKPVRFEKIKRISESDTELMVSFKGKDQRGALLAAAQALYDAEFEILSAKAHTWGRQIEDIFTIKKRPGWEQDIKKIELESNETLIF